MPSITGLATNSALTAVENKIPDVIILVKKTDYNTKISKIKNNVSDHNHDKYATTPGFNILAARGFNARLVQADLVTKADFDVRLQSLNKKINSNKTKHLIAETKFNKLEKFDKTYFRGKNYFDGDGTRNCLVFQSVYMYFERVGDEISSWESKGLFSGKIRPVTTSESKLVYDNARIKVKFNGDLLKQNKVTCNHRPTVNIYTVYRLIPTTKDSSVTLQNCLFGAVKLTKHSDVDKYKYFGYGTGFDSRGSFTHPVGGYGRNDIVFGADLSSSTHANNKTRSILVLGKDFIQGIDCTTIYAEKMYQLILL